MVYYWTSTMFPTLATKAEKETNVRFPTTGASQNVGCSLPGLLSGTDWLESLQKLKLIF